MTFGSERGAILVQTAVASLVMAGFATFVIDYGVLWVSRNQAQNAADAGAVAGAVARGYDDFDDPPEPGGMAEQSAAQTARANLVWNAPAIVVVSYGCPAGGVAGGRCVEADVHRDQEFGNAIPTLFGRVLGITSQGVRAKAIAQVAPGNATDCLRPWAIPDKWLELRPVPAPWAPGVVFDRYIDGGGGAIYNPHDVYVPPDASGPGTGLTLSDDPAVTFDFYKTVNDPIMPGWLLPLALPGLKTYGENIDACNGQTVTVGQSIPISPAATKGATISGMTNLYAQDTSASWNSATNKIEGSCAPVCAPISPRLVAIAVFDVDAYQLKKATDDWSGCPGGAPCVRVSNIMGFFIGSVAGPSGYLTRYPGMVVTSTPTLNAQSSFLKAINLVR